MQRVRGTARATGVALFALALAAVAGCGGGGGGAHSVPPTAPPTAAPVTVTEYPVVPANNPVFGPSCPSGIASIDSGIWFLDQCGYPATEGRVDPSSHAVALYPAALASPQPFVNCGMGLAPGGDGGLWGTFSCGTISQNLGGIARFDPLTHVVLQYPNTGTYACPTDIAAGPDGRMWFTLQCSTTGQANSPGAVGAINEQTGVISYFPLPTGLTCPSNAPFGMTLGPDGAMWFGIFTAGCTEQGYLGRIVPSSGTITTVPVPAGAYSCPYGLTTGSDHALWFTLACDPGGIGRYDPVKGTFTTYPIPTQNAKPHGIIAGADGAIWFGEWEVAKIGRITTAGAVTEYPLLTQTFTQGFTLGPDGAVWFAELGGNIGRIK